MADTDQTTGAAKQAVRITPEDEQLLVDLLAAYKQARRIGKFFGMLVVGSLGFIVLLFQAWEAFKGFFTSKLGSP